MKSLKKPKKHTNEALVPRAYDTSLDKSPRGEYVRFGDIDVQISSNPIDPGVLKVAQSHINIGCKEEQESLRLDRAGLSGELDWHSKYHMLAQEVALKKAAEQYGMAYRVLVDWYKGKPKDERLEEFLSDLPEGYTKFKNKNN